MASVRAENGGAEIGVTCATEGLFFFFSFSFLFRGGLGMGGGRGGRGALITALCVACALPAPRARAVAPPVTGSARGGAPPAPTRKGPRSILERKFIRETATADDGHGTVDPVAHLKTQQIPPASARTISEALQGRMAAWPGAGDAPPGGGGVEPALSLADQDFPPLPGSDAEATRRPGWASSARRAGDWLPSGGGRVMDAVGAGGRDCAAVLRATAGFAGTPPASRTGVEPSGGRDMGAGIVPVREGTAGVWPASTPALEMLRAGRAGFFPAEACLWRPQERSWQRVVSGAARTSLTACEPEVSSQGHVKIRRMVPKDIDRMGAINDACPFTETFPRTYYLTYMQRWPSLTLAAEDGQGSLLGYILAKSETGAHGLYCHISALSVKPAARRSGIATRLMAQVELESALKVGALYVDLFCKVTNTLASQYYAKLGYKTYRTVKGYYSDGHDALDMRKSLPADTEGRCMRPRTGPAPLSEFMQRRDAKEARGRLR